MKGKFSFWIQLFALAAGVVLISMHERINLVRWVIVFVGFMFAIPGLWGIAEALWNRRYREVAGAPAVIAAVGSSIVGLIMIFCPGPFETVFVYLLSIALIVGGVWHLWLLSVGLKVFKLPGWLYVLPVLVVMAGIALLVAPVRQSEAVFTLIAGIAMVCVAANGLFIYLATYDSRPDESTAKNVDTTPSESASKALEEHKEN